MINDLVKGKIFMGLMLLGVMVGFFIIISGDGDYALIGIVVKLLSCFIFGNVALMYSLRAEQSFRKEKEERMKRLENDIAFIKTKLGE